MFLPLGDDVEKREPPIGTALLIAANLLVFLYMVRLTMDAGGSGEPHFQFCHDWGLIPTELAQGNIIELFTSMFVHGDFFHIAGNLVVLWAFAQTLEYVLGTGRFLLLYFVGGLAAGLAQCAVDFECDIPMVGASGAIAAVMGAYCFSFGPTANIRTLIWIVKPFVVRIPACIFAVVWLLMQYSDVLESAAAEDGGGVAWMAHIGGFLAGSVLMPLVNDGRRQLVRNWRDGTTVVADLDAPAQPRRRVSSTAPKPPAVTNDCAYCGTSLEQAVPLAETLLRCGNPNCARLNYRTAPVAPPEPQVADPPQAAAAPHPEATCAV